MTMKRRSREGGRAGGFPWSLPVALLAIALVAAACGGGGGEGPGTGGSSGTPKAGGVYRTALENFGFTGGFDPTGEYLGTAWGIFNQLMLRTLVGTNHVAGAAGNALVPDLATDTGKVSGDGLTYTFTLKPGIKFGPPINRAVTTKDIAYAFQRIDSAPLVAQYGFYYDGTIVGMDGPHDGGPKPISGIETPDDKTIVFHLQQPTGDFLYRLSMPATAPIPPELGKCFTEAGAYGRDVVSTGPYMIKGADQVDASSCGKVKPMVGFDPTSKLILVRNPSYDPATDSAEARSNFLDGVSVTINTNTADIFQQIEAGTLDGSFGSTPPKPVEAKYLTDPTLRPLLHSDSADRTWYITMNYLTPPFDDVHVRKAVNFVIDKAALQKVWGGPIHGDIATHILPASLVPGFPSGYDPYPSPGHAGDVNAAKNEMKQSKYDHDGDGVCDDPVCQHLLFVNRTAPPHVDMSPIIQANLASIGLDLTVRELDASTAYTTIQTVSNLIPIAANAGWGKDYPDPSTFAVLFDSSGVICQGQVNYSEIGISAAKAKECNVQSAYQKVAASIPNVDQQIDHCNALLGADRNSCWIQFDQFMMENAVPWVPYLDAKNLTLVNQDVTLYAFDQFSGTISLAHVAVSNNVSASSL